MSAGNRAFKGNIQPLALLSIIFTVFVIMIVSCVAYQSIIGHINAQISSFHQIYVSNGGDKHQDIDGDFGKTSASIAKSKFFSFDSININISEKIENLTKDYVDEAVKTAEWQWKYQKWEVGPKYKQYNDNLKRYNPNYPCFLGEQVAGYQNIQDGNKWVCGLPHIGHGFENINNPNVENHTCIVYSIGCSNQFEFEESILENGPKHCQVHTFDPFSKHDKQPNNPRLHFHSIGIGIQDNVNDKNEHFQTLPNIMKSLNHLHIDILKIDVEGAEWQVFKNLDFNSTAWPIGQIQIESM